MTRKLLMAAVLLAACTTGANAQSVEVAAAPADAASFVAAGDAAGFALARLQPPTMVHLSLPAVAPVIADGFRVTVMFDDSGSERPVLEKRAEAAFAKVQKAVGRVHGVKASIGMRQFRLDSDTRCSSTGNCISAGPKPVLHAELELTSDSRESLGKALAEARKATSKDSSLTATRVSAQRSAKAIETAHRNALVNGQRAVEAAAAALTKDGGRWQIAAIEFDEREPEEMAAAAPKTLPPSIVMTQPGAGLPPQMQMPASGPARCNCNEVELRATATIMVFPPAPKP